MAPGPPNLTSNRFSLLDSPPPKKKKQKNIQDVTLEFFPNLKEIKKSTDDPKYITIETVNCNKNLTDFSCFSVYRSLKIISPDITSISQIRDGKLLLLVKNKETVQKFIKASSLAGICEIKSKFHDNLNSVKGTIFAPMLNNIDEQEIVQELGSQGLISAYKFNKTVDGTAQPSGVVLLTFDRYILPSTIDIAWTKLTVRQHIPSPMRCKICQLLGHTSKFCKKSLSCDSCGLPPHSPISCTRTYCVNCAEAHPASSKDCPKYTQAKEYLKIKINNKCSMSEAVKIYKQNLPPLNTNAISFSAVVAQTSAKTNSNINNSKTNSNSSAINNSDSPAIKPLFSSSLTSETTTSSTNQTLPTSTLNNISSTQKIKNPYNLRNSTTNLPSISRSNSLKYISPSTLTLPSLPTNDTANTAISLNSSIEEFNEKYKATKFENKPVKKFRSVRKVL